ncbi:hypothetical protein HTZ84_05155 [Haloterrigena sp. SYSU A558-1]|uniref:3D domain-containing protein n=1 Tax=Haloterrigena gelatinilytica TaxID=2741724 RepID=A0ABX2LG46_9EURY|nr:hypothetical protein [Haloterrigena gelatinilytica]NUC71701.1 hypothetical protein [Haloterrigena gelatinilytica]
MASGDLSLFEPGDRPTVTLVADSSGNVPDLNDFVELTGENAQHAEVSVVENAGAGVATVARLPDEYDPNASYSAGDVIGEATVLLRHPVDWVTPSDGTDLSPGDLVVSDAGGTVAAYDSAGGDTADMIVGPVWTTIAKGNYTAGKVAVVRRN